MVKLTIKRDEMKTSDILVFLVVFSACTFRFDKTESTFSSTCILYGSPDLVITLYSNGRFEYKMPYVEDINGSWTQIKDTLVLTSERFSAVNPSEAKPANIYNKYTDLEGDKDQFLIKGKKLYAINKNGVSKKCELTKVKIR